MPGEDERWLGVWERVTTSISRWAIGVVVIATIAGTTQGVTAWLLGSSYAVALGVIAGLLDMIPNLGATLAGVILVPALWAEEGLTAAIIMLVVLLVYQQVENNILTPKIQGKAVNLSGFFIIVAVTLFGALLGVLGALTAVPLAATIQIFIQELTQPAGPRSRRHARRSKLPNPISRSRPREDRGRLLPVGSLVGDPRLPPPFLPLPSPPPPPPPLPLLLVELRDLDRDLESVDDLDRRGRDSRGADDRCDRGKHAADLLGVEPSSPAGEVQQVRDRRRVDRDKRGDANERERSASRLEPRATSAVMLASRSRTGVSLVDSVIGAPPVGGHLGDGRFATEYGRGPSLLVMPMA